jgi:ribose/xylose/arabinose/galactoside ABC-type transport system permease subunit
MNIIGYARSLQGSFVTLLVTLSIVGILTWVALLITSQLEDTDEVLTWRNRIFFGVKLSLVVTVGIFLVNAMILGFTDRMPRSDVDKQPVYDQMNSH